MKKIIAYLSLILMIAFMSVSCKTREKCPAYGKTARLNSVVKNA